MIYVYKCRNKNEAHKHVVNKGIQDPHPETCPEELPNGEVCGESVYRVYTPLSVIFKGSGFYATDKILYDPPDPYYDAP